MGEEEREAIARYSKTTGVESHLFLYAAITLACLLSFGGCSLLVITNVNIDDGIRLIGAMAAVMFALLIFMGYILLVTRRFNSKWDNLATSLKQLRSDQDEDTFVEYFASEGTPAIAARETYRWFQKLIGDADLPVGPNDGITAMYKVDSLDRESMVLDLLPRCNCRTPTDDEHDELVWSTETVGDLVRGLGKLVITPASAPL